MFKQNKSGEFQQRSGGVTSAEMSWHYVTCKSKCLLQWSQMETQGLTPNEWTYNAKVKVHSSVGAFNAALDTVQQMQAHGVMPGKGTWDVIVSMAELMERPDIVQQVVLHILYSRDQLNLVPCAGLIDQYASNQTGPCLQKIVQNETQHI